MSPSRISLFSAGSNAKGQLAQGTVDDSHCFLRCMFDGDVGDPLSNGIKSLSLAFGANHTLMLLRDIQDENTLWVCGDGRKGQIGEEHRARTAPLTAFRRLDLMRPPGYEYSCIAACWETSFISLSHPDKNDILLSLGADDYGDRGVGGLRASASLASFSSVSFDHLMEEDDESDSIQICDIKAGTHHVLVKLSCRCRNGSRRTFFAGWGASRHGQLGRSTIESFTSTPITISIPEALDVVSFAVGNHHSVFVYSPGQIMTLGSDRKNQTQGLSSIQDAHSVGATWNGTYVLRIPRSEKWRIYATGSNSKGQLASPPSDAAARDVTFQEESAAEEVVCGSEHVLVRLKRMDLKSVGEVWSWGWNEHGNLGLGHVEDVHEPTRIWPTEDFTNVSHEILGIWAGFGTTWIAIACDLTS
ncbi:RCC1/BLIP-II protein [Schizopora paradoxa]|uniref:RCC1/BLIP-II protein n=1 Tax=Schizopora paradoxa TaxID=27342 RepID=A0A0H2S8I7_9AGAM|nr:RCC1/BLIP-II protein [Schizopora paradoxa]